MELLKFIEFINEKTKEVVYPTDFSGMVQSALAGIYNSVISIAQELANEKAARNPSRYTGQIEEVDITRAMNLIFHSDWKKKLKKQALGQMIQSSVERANKKDEVVNKKNIRAMARQNGDKKFDFVDGIDTSQSRFSDKRSGGGPGSNQ